MKKRRSKNLDAKTQYEIIADYQMKDSTGDYKYTLQVIADKYDIGLGTVNALAKRAKIQGRPVGGKRPKVPNARIMKILRDYSEPGATLEVVGRLNPRVKIISGQRVVQPLTKQRVKQIVDRWRDRSINFHSRGFAPGDMIEWGGRCFTVLRYDGPRGGAVRDDAGDVIDPFRWRYSGFKAKLVVG